MLTVDMVTEGKDQGGIYEYTRYLKEASKCEINLLTEGRGWTRSDQAIHVKPTARIVHVQHEPGLFGADSRMINLVDQLHLEKRRVVVTFHGLSVEPRWSHYLRELCRRVDRVIVHTSKQLEILRGHGVVDHVTSERGLDGHQHVTGRVVHIPHGTYYPPKLMSKAHARRRLHLPHNLQLLVSGGFFDYTKGSMWALEVLNRLKQMHPHIAFAQIGGLHPGLYKRKDVVNQHRYLLRDLMVVSQREKLNFYLDWGYLSDAQRDLWLSAADIIIAPYLRHPGEAGEYYVASGSVHRLIGFGKPLIITRVPRLQELEPFALTITYGNTSELIGAVDYLLSDVDTYREYAGKIRKYAEATAWSRVARQHERLYRTVT